MSWAFVVCAPNSTCVLSYLIQGQCFQWGRFIKLYLVAIKFLVKVFLLVPHFCDFSINEQLAIVKFCFLLVKKAAETIVTLKTAYKKDALGKTQLFLRVVSLFQKW